MGARDEDSAKTGFAHLFEHLMFEGSVNIPSYDAPLQMAGGENNAFTNNDITNYYLTLPAANIETGFWLESDRMLKLDFSEEKLAVQKNVVIEEYKQNYLNNPYGDAWLLLRPLAYKTHPYRWPTIGKEISHIENTSLDEVKNFFFNHYLPNNAVMVVSGNVKTEEIKELSEKWFGEIPQRHVPERNLPKEHIQTESRFLEVERDVPYDALYKVWHVCKRNDVDFYAFDLISDILGRGSSSRLFRRLVKEKQIFSSIDAYVSGDLDEGLFVVSGKLVKGVKLADADAAVSEELEKIKQELVAVEELQKVKNKVESTLVFAEMSILEKAMELAYFELMGDAGLMNRETEKYSAVTAEQIQQQAKEVFKEANCSTLYYKVKKS